MPSHQFVRFALGAMHSLGLVRLAGGALRGIGVIFCLHQVRLGAGAENGFAPNYGLACSPEFLSALVGLVHHRGYETVSLGEAVSRLKSSKIGAKPFAVFTLDDGYRDNKIHAQPVFQQHGCPYTIFVAPRIIEGTCELWWRVVELAIAKTDHFQVGIKGKIIDQPATTLREKHQAWNVAFLQFYQMDEYEQRKAVRELASKYGIDVDGICREEAMNWKEVREISKDPLCTIGAHTLSHYALSKLPDEDAYRELRIARLEIEKGIGKPVLFNAYPYGDKQSARTREFQLAGKAGYEASVTTRPGVIFSDHANHLHALPRIMVSGRYHEMRYVDTLLSGLPTALSNRFSRVSID